MSESDKLKILLRDKELQCQTKIKKFKKRMKIMKIISVSISVSTIIILAVTASSLILSPLVVSILSTVSASLLGIDLKFKFENKTGENKRLIDKLSKIQNKLEYVNSCNGDMTEQEYLDIFKEFNTVL